MTAFPAIVDGEPRGSDGEPLKPHQEWDHAEGCPIGRDPRTMSVRELNALGHYKRPLLEAVRQNCIDCAGGNQAEARRCGMVSCPFWPYRMNSNPFAAKRTEAQKAAILALNSAKASASSGTDGSARYSDTPDA